MRKKEGLRKFYFEVYKHIVKNGRLLAELYNHGLDCAVFNNIITTPVTPRRQLQSILKDPLGLNETKILEIHLKKADPERYNDISKKMGLALSGFKSLEKSRLLYDREIKQLLKISARIYKTYADDLWRWYLNKFNANFGVNKDLKTDKQTVEWIVYKLFNYIKPFKERADNAWNRTGQTNIPNTAIHEMIADIVNHGLGNDKKLSAKKVKWHIENYEKIKV